MHLPLSVLDLVPLASGADPGQAIRDSVDLAVATDHLGYTRHWFAEHHNMPTIASTTPEVVIALAAEKTKKIRIGSGGVMLPNHAPLKVAETFKMLNALYPGRIDLGIGRAPGTDAGTALALRGSRAAISGDDFPAQLLELLDYGMDGIHSPLNGRMVTAVPKAVELPPIWLLGSSDFSARFAAKLGMGFGFAAHFSDMPPEIPMRLYREGFADNGPLEKPHAILTLSVTCAPSREEAEYLMASPLVAFARLRTGQTSMLLPPEEANRYEFSAAEMTVVEELRARYIMGTPSEVREKIEAIATATRADEVMISTFMPVLEHRMRSYELLADAFALPVAA